LSVFHDFIQQCRQEHRRLSGVLAAWEKSAGEENAAHLPLSPPPQEPFRLARQVLDLRSAIPPIEALTHAWEPEQPSPEGDAGNAPSGEPEAAAAEDPAEDIWKRIEKKVAILGIEIAGINGRLLEQLSDLVLSSLLARTLLMPEDRFPVSSLSVMGAMALANFSYVIHQGGEQGKSIDLPLRVARLHSDRFLPGDLLFWDLAARSIMKARGREFSPESGSVFDRYLPEFVSHSVLAKLESAFDLPTDALKQSRFDAWPGLRTLLMDEGAGSIRRNMVGRLAAGCRRKPRRGMAIIIRWLRAMEGLDEDVQWHASLMFARLLWELLEMDEAVVQKMARRGEPCFMRAVAQIETIRRAGPPADDGAVRAYHYVCDVASCLDDYATYGGLCQMSRSLAGAPGSGSQSDQEDTEE
jgi:hypothetical protein